MGLCGYRYCLVDSAGGWRLLLYEFSGMRQTVYSVGSVDELLKVTEATVACWASAVHSGSAKVL